MKWLAHPLTFGLDIDDTKTTLLRRRIIREKKFLERIYKEWYAGIVAALPEGPGPILELGSGAGFLKEFIPKLITSEIFHLPGIASGARWAATADISRFLTWHRAGGCASPLTQGSIFFYRGGQMSAIRRCGNYDRALGDVLVENYL